MSKVNLKGNPINVFGELPAHKEKIKEFYLVKSDLSTVKTGEYQGKNKILNIFPSVDTPVCALSVRKFNQLAAEIPNTAILCISKDLPFAFQRFCGAEGIKNVDTLSAFRDLNFGKNFGVEIMDGPLEGLFARAIIIYNEHDEVIYTELVPEIGQEPDYEKALSILKKS